MNNVVILNTEQDIITEQNVNNIIISNITDSIVNTEQLNVLVEDNNKSTIVVENIKSNSVIAGLLTPISEEDMVYSKRVDFISDNEIYRGEADAGASTSANKWRIRKISVNPVDGDITEIWADGVASFTKIWDNRLSYTYS